MGLKDKTQKNLCTVSMIRTPTCMLTAQACHSFILANFTELGKLNGGFSSFLVCNNH